MNVLSKLKQERTAKYKGGIYHATQIMFAYNSNHIEGTRLTEEQTRYIYETGSFFPNGDDPIHTDDIIETVNHFNLFDYMLDHADEPLTEEMIKEFHRILKTGTSNAVLDWFNVGKYKSVGNIVGDTETVKPDEVPAKMYTLINRYNSKPSVTLKDLADFHHTFESIHPFQDGNGRVGRMILFKETLKNNIMPFVILDRDKIFYYRGLQKYPHEKGYLIGTFQMEQDLYAELLEKLSPQTEEAPKKETNPRGLSR